MVRMWGVGVLEMGYVANNNNVDASQGQQLLVQLDGLPLAIAQAGAYLQESGNSLQDYLRFYEQQWDELMESKELGHTPLLDYPDRSVWTTWAMSYHTIRDKHEATANLLLLWSVLSNKGLRYELFAAACKASETALAMLSEWIGEIANSQLKFSNAMVLLRSFSLVEQTHDSTSYVMHPVVHRWAFYYQGTQFAKMLHCLAIMTVGWAVSPHTGYFSLALQRQFVPHVQACFGWLLKSKQKWALIYDGACEVHLKKNRGEYDFLKALQLLGLSCRSHGKPREAEQIYKWALRGQEEALGPTNELTLATVNDLGILYSLLQQLDKAESMFKRALNGREAKFGPNNSSALETANNLGILFTEKGNLAEAERIFKRTLRGKEEALGADHISTLYTIKNLGSLYDKQGKLEEAHQMYERALQGFENGLSEARFQQYLPALDTLQCLGESYTLKGEHYKALGMYARAFIGLQGHLDPSSNRYIQLAGSILDSAAKLQRTGE
jgi:tetratricopeptide (TPR) repeat protein